MLIDREFEEEDFGFMEQLVAVYLVWKVEEFGMKNVVEFMFVYFMYNGMWFVWEFDGIFVVVSFYLEWVFLNGKLWFGIVVVVLEVKEKGIGCVVIEEIVGWLRVEYKVMFIVVFFVR